MERKKKHAAKHQKKNAVTGRYVTAAQSRYWPKLTSRLFPLAPTTAFPVGAFFEPRSAAIGCFWGLVNAGCGTFFAARALP